MVAQYISSANIRFVAFNYRSEINKQDIIIFYDTVGRIVGINSQGVFSGPYYFFVPMGCYSKILLCTITDLRI